jgi:nitronate monooxygenase
MRTAFTDLVGCVHPLQQAAMGGVARPELAGAVARAGALGMLCEFDTAPSEQRMQQALALAASGNVGMGFFGQWMSADLETFERAAATLRVVEVFWTAPDASVVARARSAGPALVAWQVGSVADALAAEDAGCDFVISQGVEAGGHVRGTVPRDELLESVLASITIPVVAAGGIATSAEVARVIASGAAAVRVGTAFVATEESGANRAYMDALVSARSGDDTALTTRFGVGWPDAPHRVLKSAIAAAESHVGEVVGDAGEGAARRPVPRFSVEPPGRDFSGDIDAMALYAGMGVGAVSQCRSAADLVADLVSELPLDG